MNSLVDEIYDKYSDQLTKKGAIRNNRTSEGLMTSIVSELSSIDPGTDEGEVRDKFDRAAFAYMNEPLMFKLVRKFDNLPLPEEDRISAARVGFTIAMDRFDPTLGFKFSTFAWRVISNEIIHANRQYLKPSTYNEDDRDVYANNHGKVIKITKSKNARKVRYKGEDVIPHNIVVLEYGSENIYPYVYNLEVEVGDEVSPGLKLGRTAGAIINIISTDELIDSEDFGDVIFHNISDDKEADDSVEGIVLSNRLNRILTEGIERLSDIEQKIITDRFLTHPRVPRHALSDELGISEYRIAKKEREALEKLKEVLEENNIRREDVDL